MKTWYFLLAAAVLTGCGHAPVATAPATAAMETAARAKPLAGARSACQAMLESTGECDPRDAASTRVIQLEMESTATLYAPPDAIDEKLAAYRFNVTLEYKQRASDKLVQHEFPGVYGIDPHHFYFDGVNGAGDKPFKLAKSSVYKAS